MEPSLNSASHKWHIIDQALAEIYSCIKPQHCHWLPKCGMATLICIMSLRMCRYEGKSGIRVFTIKLNFLALNQSTGEVGNLRSINASHNQLLHSTSSL